MLPGERETGCAGWAQVVAVQEVPDGVLIERQADGGHAGKVGDDQAFAVRRTERWEGEIEDRVIEKGDSKEVGAKRQRVARDAQEEYADLVALPGCCEHSE